MYTKTLKFAKPNFTLKMFISCGRVWITHCVLNLFRLGKGSLLQHKIKYLIFYLFIYV